MYCLNEFLIKSKDTIKLGINLSSYTFVTGNSSCDLDSFVSSIAFSYFNYLDKSFITIPFHQIKKHELNSRKDIQYLLKINQIDENNLIFIDDFLSIFEITDIVSVVLVDHNSIDTSSLLVLNKKDKIKIIGIIDHHIDDLCFLNCKPRIIRTSGSCTSLVFDYWYEKLCINFYDFKQIFFLLLASLLIDTSNMKVKVKKVDLVSYNFYLKYIDMDNEKEKYNVLNYYNSILEKKKDLTGLKFDEIVYKDFKQFYTNNLTVGISSIQLSFSSILNSFPLDVIFRSFIDVMKKKNVKLLILTMYYVEEEVQKDFFYCFKKIDKNSLTRLDLLNTENLDLIEDTFIHELITEKAYNNNQFSILDFKIFNQKNTKISRKEMIPIIKKLLEKNN